MVATLIQADARRIPLADKSVHCVVTSPPYWGLRDYGTGGQIGLESTPADFVGSMVAVFREVHRVLRDDGTLWLNLGDSYCNAGSRNNGTGLDGKRRGGVADTDGSWKDAVGTYRDIRHALKGEGIKHKDLIGIPWRVALALQSDGWYLRSEIIWHKASPMPESVTDRPTKAHEPIFLLAKEDRYFYDADAVREQPKGTDPRVARSSDDLADGPMRNSDLERFGTTRGKTNQPCSHPAGANLRSVWRLSTDPYPGAHFATFPRKLVEPCIKAGTSEKGCCPSCGSPWRRVTERSAIKRQRPNDFVKRSGEDGTGNSCANTVAGVSVRTIGWEPTCGCPDHTPVPCTVFDPFNGAGTTGVVALAHGRRYVGTDLNCEYLGMARRRIDRPHAPVERPSEDVPLPLFSTPN